MAVKMTTPMSEVDVEIRRILKKSDEDVLRCLARLGEECVTKARDRSEAESWINHTGNLRSSIGYVITRGGAVVSVAGFSGEGEGVSEGRKAALELAASFRNDYALIVVAGMNYASYVESLENKDVLATPELYARRRAPELLGRLKEQTL